MGGAFSMHNLFHILKEYVEGHSSFLERIFMDTRRLPNFLEEFCSFEMLGSPMVILL
jgi:hypothetical protein